MRELEVALHAEPQRRDTVRRDLAGAREWMAAVCGPHWLKVGAPTRLQFQHAGNVLKSMSTTMGVIEYGTDVTVGIRDDQPLNCYSVSLPLSGQQELATGGGLLLSDHDTGIVLPNMGRHFIKDSLLDAAFDAGHPELLVYSPDSARLLAVEYAVPIALSAQAPEGFEGSQDQWVQFGGTLWTLHAWVYKDNPDGVFNPTNKRVQ